jgi:hypothetical protein
VRFCAYLSSGRFMQRDSGLFTEDAEARSLPTHAPNLWGWIRISEGA